MRGRLALLTREHANIAVALNWFLDQGELAEAAAILADVWLYWALRGHAGEGMRWAERVMGAEVSTSYFQLLGVTPFLGRDFNTADAAADRDAVVLSHGFWMRRFGGDFRTSLRSSDTPVDLPTPVEPSTAKCLDSISSIST